MSVHANDPVTGDTNPVDGSSWSKSEILFLICILSLTAAIRIRMSVLPVDYLANMHLIQYKAGTVLLEDSFYTLNIARNFAFGAGLTHDGVHQTTGVQPLAMLIASAGYRLFPADSDLPVTLFLCLLSVVSIVSMLFMYLTCRILAGAFSGSVALLIWAAAPTALMQINGLETSLAVCFNMVLIYMFVCFMRRDPDQIPPVNHALVFGVVAGLAVFARLDALILIGILGLILINYFRRFSGSARHKLIRIAVAAGSAVVCYLPWPVLAYIHTGRISYDSGIARRQIAKLMAGESVDTVPGLSFYQDNLIEMGRAFVEMHPVVQPWLTMPGSAVTAFGLSILLGFGLLFRHVRLTHLERTTYISLALYAAVLISSYVFYQYGRDFYHRYLATVIFISMCPVSVIAIKFLRVFKTKFSTAAVLVVSMFYCIVIPVTCRSTVDYFSHWTARTDYYRTGYYRFSGMARWMKEKTAPGTRIGSFQTGQLSYYSNRTVINLDGIVNRDAFRAIQKKRMAGYIRTLDLDYIADWDLMIRKLLQDVSSNPLTDSELELVYSGYFRVYRFLPGNLDRSTDNSL
jgi:hypothetical protein